MGRVTAASQDIPHSVLCNCNAPKSGSPAHIPQAAIRFGFIRSWRALTRELPGNTRSSAAVTTALKEPRIAGRASHPSANRSPIRVPGLHTEMTFLTATGVKTIHTGGGRDSLLLLPIIPRGDRIGRVQSRGGAATRHSVN